MDVPCECCVLSGRVLCVGLITRPDESYRVLCGKWLCSVSFIREVMTRNLVIALQGLKEKSERWRGWRIFLWLRAGGRESLLIWRIPYSAPSSFRWRYAGSKVRTLGSEEGKVMGRALVGISTADKRCVSCYKVFCMNRFLWHLVIWSWHLIHQSKHVAVKCLNIHTAAVSDGYSPFIHTHQTLFFLAHMTPEYHRVSRLRDVPSEVRIPAGISRL